MIVYMKNEYLGHFSVNVFVRASDTVDIGMLVYSSDPILIKNCEIILINILYNRCCHIAEGYWAKY